MGGGLKNRINDIQRPQLGLIIKNTKKVDIVTKHLSTQTNRKEKSFFKFTI